MTLAKNSTDWMWLKLLCLTIIATLTFEHSQFDVRISKLFYANGHWLLEKARSLMRLFFMIFPNYY